MDRIGKPAQLFAAMLLLMLGAVACPAQSYPPAWSPSATYHVGDQVQLNGNVLRAVKTIPNPSTFVYADWELWEVRSNTTVMVGPGQMFANLQAAWAYVANARIAGSVYLHLYISTAHGDLTESFAQAFSLDHPCGGLISILGDNASKINFSVAGITGFTVDNGFSFNTLSNFQITSTNGNGSYGILASGGVIANVAGVTLNSWNNGVQAQNGGNIHCANNVHFSNCPALFFATLRGFITIDPGFTSSTPGVFVVQANYGGEVVCSQITIDNADEGLRAYDGGTIISSFSSFSACGYAIISFEGSLVLAYSCTFTGSTVDDVDCTRLSFVYLGGNTASKTVLGSNDSSYIYTN